MTSGEGEYSEEVNSFICIHPQVVARARLELAYNSLWDYAGSTSSPPHNLINQRTKTNKPEKYVNKSAVCRLYHSANLPRAGNMGVEPTIRSKAYYDSSLIKLIHS